MGIEGGIYPGVVCSLNEGSTAPILAPDPDTLGKRISATAAGWPDNYQSSLSNGRDDADRGPPDRVNTRSWPSGQDATGASADVRLSDDLERH